MREEQSERVVIGGIELTLIATKIVDAEWELAVESVHGVTRLLSDFFATPEQAIAAAREAINVRGVEAFITEAGEQPFTGSGADPSA